MNSQNKNQENFNEFGEEPNNVEAPIWEGITPKDKFIFAKWVLLIVAILFLLGGIALMINPTNGECIFDACKTILPPIATLILGYYFSESNR